MQGNRKVLDVPPDCAEHAARFGAVKTGSGIWYAEEPLSSELLNYLPQDRNPTFAETPPLCKACGAATRKLTNRRGQPFWLCRRPGCGETVDYLEYLESAAPPKTLNDFLPPVLGGLFSAKDEGEGLQETRKEHPLRSRWVHIVSEAMALLGSPEQVVKWLETPKMQLRNKAPITLLGTHRGCDAVLDLLREVWR